VKGFGLYFFLGALLVSALAEPATAGEKAAPAGAIKAGPASNAPSRARPAMTKEECEGLGGTVDEAVTCTGGKGCFTTDRNKGVHMVCVDAVVH